jgi:hypothetical protein
MNLPQQGETGRAFLRRTPHEFVASQNTSGSVPRGACACGLYASDAIHSGTSLLATYAYLCQLTRALNGLCDDETVPDSAIPQDPAEMPATAGAILEQRS